MSNFNPFKLKNKIIKKENIAPSNMEKPSMDSINKETISKVQLAERKSDTVKFEDSKAESNLEFLDSRPRLLENKPKPNPAFVNKSFKINLNKSKISNDIETSKQLNTQLTKDNSWFQNLTEEQMKVIPMSLPIFKEDGQYALSKEDTTNPNKTTEPPEYYSSLADDNLNAGLLKQHLSNADQLQYMSVGSEAVEAKFRNVNSIVQVPDLLFDKINQEEYDDECWVEIGEAVCYDDGTVGLTIAGVECDLVEGVDVKFSHELVHGYIQDGEWNYYNYGQVNYKYICSPTFGDS